MQSIDQRIDNLSEKQRVLLAHWIRQRQTDENPPDGQRRRHPEGVERKRLTAYVVLKATTGNEPTGDTEALRLRDHLRQQLPAFMVPECIVSLDSLPKLPNGKTNFKALPEPEVVGIHGEKTSREPRTDVERTLADIWTQLLGLEHVGMDDNFFEVGGDSIISIQFVSRARQAGLPIEPGHMATHPTIAQLAQVADQQKDILLPWKSLVPIQSTGTKPPLFCVHAGGSYALFYRHLAKRLGSGQPVFGLQPIGLDGNEPPLDTIEQIATHYVDELRSVQPQGPYHLVGYCIGATVSLEMARVLERQGQQVAQLVILDSGFWWGAKPSASLLHRARKISKIKGVAYPFLFASRKVRHRIMRWRQLRFGNATNRHHAVLSIVEDACRKAFRNYVPSPCQAPITLIRTSEYANIEAKSRHLKWRGLTPKLDIQVIPGKHDHMLLEPDVQHVARLIAACLVSVSNTSLRSPVEQGDVMEGRVPATKSVAPSA